MASQFMIWNPDPIFFTVPFLNWPVRWYGFTWALAFFFANLIMGRFFKAENRPMKNLDPLTYYMLIATLVGARLGHCFFYEPEKYFADPLAILKIQEGGLASHGAATGIIIGMWLYCRKYKENLMWLFDRIVIVCSLGAAFIRFGNFMNSEILGKVTNVPWAIIFTQFDQNPRHPAQLYEAVLCLVLFVILYQIWKIKRKVLGGGFIFGLFFTYVFIFRFLMEFLKENQTAFENGMILNMGQWLSIPFVALGIWMMRRAVKNPTPKS
jgi:phosphatidylglycerol:prolipoprotein diacylglycerol transferase